MPCKMKLHISEEDYITSIEKVDHWVLHRKNIKFTRRMEAHEQSLYNKHLEHFKRNSTAD